MQFKDRDLLVASLQAMGYLVEMGQGIAMDGYDHRVKVEADVVIRRDQTSRGRAKGSPYFGDIGFQKTDTGYTITIDETDERNLRAGKFIRDLRVEYNGRVAQTIAQRLNGFMAPARTEGQLVKYAISF